MSAGITALYAAIFGLAIVVLSIAVSVTRARKGIEHGDGGDDRLHRLIRIHGNFAEFVPLALVLMLILEIGGGSPTLLHGLGIALIVGRVAHIFGLAGARDWRPGRAAGSLLTNAVIVVAAFAMLRQVLM